jgi:hypothetical protein
MGCSSTSTPTRLTSSSGQSWWIASRVRLQSTYMRSWLITRGLLLRMPLNSEALLEPDIAYAMQQICLHMHDPREPHLMAMKHILHYLHGRPDFSLLLRRTSSCDLVVYTDTDWAGCPDTRRSTSSYAMFLGDNLVCQVADCRLPL